MKTPRHSSSSMVALTTPMASAVPIISPFAAHLWNEPGRNRPERREQRQEDAEPPWPTDTPAASGEQVADARGTDTICVDATGAVISARIFLPF
jgi:hypothetical protein